MEDGIETDPRVLYILDRHFGMMRYTHSLINFCFKDKLTFPYGKINEIKLTIILFFFISSCFPIFIPLSTTVGSVHGLN